MKKLIKSLLIVLALSSPALAGVTISTTTTLVGPIPALLLQPNETLTYSITGTFTGETRIERSYDATNWIPVGISTTNHSGGTVSGTLMSGSEMGLFRWNSSTITAGAFVYYMADNDDFVTERLNNKKVPVAQTYDDSFRITGYAQSEFLRLTQTYSISTTTPTFIGQIAMDTNYDIYVASGTDNPTQWIKVGAQ